MSSFYSLSPFSVSVMLECLFPSVYAKAGPVKGKTYTSRANLTYPLAGLVCKRIGTKLYVVGGHRGDNVYQNNMLIYDIITDTWTQSPKVTAAARYMAMAAVHNEKFYYCGGRLSSYFPYLERYDPLNDTWTRLADCPIAVADGCLVTVGDRLYLYGGLLAGSGDTSRNAELYYYDIQMDTWHHQPILQKIDARAYPRGFAYDRGFILVGGQKATGTTGETWYYDAYENAYKPKALGPAIYGGALTELGGHMYLLGGWNGSNPSGDIFEYNVSLDKWTKINDTPINGRFSNGAESYDKSLFLVAGSTTGSSANASNTLFRID